MEKMIVYKSMMRTLKEVEPKMTAAKGLINITGAKVETKDLLASMDNNVSAMAAALDNFITAMTTNYTLLMDANAQVFELNKSLFNTWFNDLSAMLDGIRKANREVAASLKGGEE